MSFLKSSTQRRVFKSINLLLVLTLVLGLVPQSVIATSTSSSGIFNQRCVVSTQSSGASEIYLPFIGGLQNLAEQISGADTPQALTRQLQYEVGKTYTYGYEVAVESKSSQRNADGVSTPTSGSMTVIQAEADITITEQESDGTFVGQVTLRNPLICNTDGTNDTFITDEVTLNALDTPMVFKQKPTGEVTDLSVPSDSPAQSIDIQKGVINTLQLILKEEDSYTVQENGGQGVYNVSYTLEEKENQLQISRSFTDDSFTNLFSRGDENTALTLENRSTLVLDGTRGVLESVSYTEDIVSGDSEEDPVQGDEGTGFDGTTAWSEVRSQGGLTLKSVSTANLARLAMIPMDS